MTDMRRLIDLTDRLESHIEDEEISGQRFERLVWKKTSSFKPNSLPSVGLPNVKGLFGIHVTSDPEYWFKRLQNDYERDGDGYVMEVVAVDGDVLAKDNQFAILGDDGIDPDTHVLVTSRTEFTEGKDYRYVRVLKDDRKERSSDLEQHIRRTFSKDAEDGEFDSFEDEDDVKAWIISNFERYLTDDLHLNIDDLSYDLYDELDNIREQ